jgi:hypothetical protein
LEEDEKMIASKTISLLGKTFHLKFQVLDTPRADTIGISARVPRTTDFTIFLDYEPIVDPRVKEELTYLQELFGLGDFHVFATSQYNRHAICVDRLPIREALSVLEYSTSDYHHKRGLWISEHRTWILRVLEKGGRPRPIHLYSVESPYNGQNFQHEGLALFLQLFYGAKVRLARPDGNTELEIQGYKTSNRIDVRKIGEMDIKKLLNGRVGASVCPS